MLNWMRASMIVMILLATIGLGASFFVEASFLGRVTVVQPIEKSSHAESRWKLAGEPISLLKVPTDVFVTKGGPGIPPQVDVAVLKGNPNAVPYEPIHQTITNARWGCILAIVFLLAGLVAIRRLWIVVPED